MGGKTPNPTYDEVSRGNTGHAESVQVTYDPKVVSYPQLVDYYWHHVDLLDGGGQFCDRGDEYRPVIFAHTPEQKQAAADSKAKLDASHRFSTPIAVAVTDAGPFTAAEDYHQNFHNTNAAYYKRYRVGCGHDRRLEGDLGRGGRHGGALKRRRATNVLSSCGGRTTRRSPASASAGSCRSSMARRRRRGCSDRRCRRRRIPSAPGR